MLSCGKVDVTELTTGNGVTEMRGVQILFLTAFAFPTLTKSGTHSWPDFLKKSRSQSVLNPEAQHQWREI